MRLWSKQFWLFFSAILVVAAAIRLYQLGSIPHGVTWDEAAIGYNGYAILTTRRDEWLVRLPISFQSFGDYKAPLAIYLNGIFTALLGMTPFAIRLPFALAAILAIAGWMLLQIELRLFSKYSAELALLTGFFLTLNPWHIHYSRIAFESGMSMSLAIWGLLLFTKVLHSKFSPRWLVLSAFSASTIAGSLYTYHSAKIVVPIMIVVVFFFVQKLHKASLTLSLPTVIFTLVLLVPLIKDTLFGPGAARAGVLLFNQGLAVPELWRAIITNVFKQLDPVFLLLGKHIATLRDGGGVWGFLHLSTYVLSVLAIPLAIRNRGYTRPLLFGLLVIAIGSLPAILATEAPHSNRGLFAVLGFLTLAMVCVRIFFRYKAVFGSIILVHIFLFVSYWQVYRSDFAKISATDFQDGYIEAFSIAREYELGSNGKQKVDKVLFSSEYGQPYIYALFVRQTNPIWYRGGSLNTYEFTDKIGVGDLNRANTLIVASASQDIPAEKAVALVYGSDGEVRFKLYLTDK
ncbi:MAG: hypothetical protein COU67_00805 [Candidatus Pacebacteria bacterium CG10_big_fil_rev_8_21_14_0_10_44_54]|nr:hypothetical protein [Candidatus Paceibacterota bacterium]PIR60809.1 MAG: hypothetical protein COU67_00805 [Candidatus Pacebacteria bacterium CG10_big_fil_rev_8_21_14_0_10_44_54]